MMWLVFILNVKVDIILYFIDLEQKKKGILLIYNLVVYFSDLCRNQHALGSQHQLGKVFRLMFHGRPWPWKRYLMETLCCGGLTMLPTTACGVAWNSM